MKCKLVLIVILLAASNFSSLWAAEQRGIVKFADQGVPGVSVTATQDDKKLYAVTDARGIYTFKDLPDGKWTITIEMLCFATIKQDITIVANVPFNPTWELKMLPLDEIKNVAAAAPPPPPPTAPVTPSTATAVSAESATAAATGATAPGAIPPAGTAPKAAAATAPTAKPNSKGFQRADLTASNADAPKPPDEPAPAQEGNANQTAAEGFLVNGSVNNGAASPFAQSAAFGNNRRGGRSMYNGNIQIVLDDSIWDANSFSVNGANTPKPGNTHLQGNANFGGPMRVQRWKWLRQGPIVTVNYTWVHNRTATTQPTNVPTAALRGGDFTALQPIFDPTTGLQFPNNKIPTTRFSSQALALLPYYPLPNSSSNPIYNYQVPLVGATHVDNLNVRVNQTINNKNQVNGLFAMTSVRQDNDNILGFLDTTDVLGFNTNATWSRRFSSRVFSTFTVAFSHQSVRVTPFFANKQNVSGAAGITGNDQDALNFGPPTLAFGSGIQSLTDGNYTLNRTQQGALTFATFWNRSPHNIRFGMDYKRQEYNYLGQQNPRGVFSFTGVDTQQIVGGVPVQTTGSDFADFLLGTPDRASIAFGNADKYQRENIWDAFVQDDWKVSPGLTLNLGLRWDYSSPISELYGRLVNLAVTPGYASATPVVGNGLVHPDRGGLEPRVSLAWRPFPASSMVIRAGYGVNYNTSVYQAIAQQMAQQSPLSTSLTVANTAATPLTLARGFVAPPNTFTNTFGIDPNFRIGYAQSWNLVIQRDLPGSLVMTATYLGIKGTRQIQQFYPNTYPVGATVPCAACLSGYVYETSNGNSTRESGQLQLRRRLHSGFTASLDYTYSKSIDDASLGGRGQGSAVVAQNWLDLSGERGLSPFDQRHLAVFSMQYSTGVGITGGTMLDGWKGRFIKDWTIVTTLNAGSGLPETPTIAGTVQGTGFGGSLRPEYTGADVYNAPAGSFFNKNAYIAPPNGQWGNAGRNSLTGPDTFTLGASMQRTFRLTDRLNGDLRIDGANVLNHVVFTSYVANFSSSQFGLPANANTMRRLTISYRLRF